MGIPKGVLSGCPQCWGGVPEGVPMVPGMSPGCPQTYGFP